MESLRLLHLACIRRELNNAPGSTPSLMVPIFLDAVMFQVISKESLGDSQRCLQDQQSEVPGGHRSTIGGKDQEGLNNRFLPIRV